jgi:hypothetical protein
MRAFDCVHEKHEDMHFMAETDDELMAKVRAHRDEYHPELSDDDLRQVVAQGAYDE